MHIRRLLMPLFLVASACTSLMVLLQSEMICGNDKFFQCTSRRNRMPSRIAMNSSVFLRQRYSRLHELLDSIAIRVETARLQALNRIFIDNITKTKESVQDVQTVNAVTDENYFSTVSNLSHVTLLRFHATTDELARVVTWKRFIAVANNCSLTTDRNPGKISSPDPKCQEDLKSLLPTQSFSSAVLSHAMPTGKLFVEDDRPVLTYLHIVHDAVVDPDGDVYSHNVRMVPWRCLWKKAAAIAAHRKPPHIYDEVSTLKT